MKDIWYNLLSAEIRQHSAHFPPEPVCLQINPWKGTGSLSCLLSLILLPCLSYPLLKQEDENKGIGGESVCVCVWTCTCSRKLSLFSDSTNPRRMCALAPTLTANLLALSHSWNSEPKNRAMRRCQSYCHPLLAQTGVYLRQCVSWGVRSYGARSSVGGIASSLLIWWEQGSSQNCNTESV